MLTLSVGLAFQLNSLCSRSGPGREIDTWVGGGSILPTGPLIATELSSVRYPRSYISTIIYWGRTGGKMENR